MATFGRLRRGVERLLSIVGLLAVVEAVSYVALKRHGEGINGMPTVAWEEFPEIDEDLLGKFTSFDAELGWVPQANMEKKRDTGDHLPGEEVKHVLKYSTDEYGSRVCLPHDRDPDADVSVSTYGDSYCFCREVSDDETYQHFLAQQLETHVGNYGAGNYGFDQALLRLKRTYPEDSTDYVVITVTASSIARILSVWKHYQEFGNVLAVKPRYELEDGELTLVESPLEEKTDLMNLRSKKDHLRTHDHHYDPWFKDHLVRRPYTRSLLRNPAQPRFALYAELKRLQSEHDITVPGIDVGQRLARTETELEQEKSRYHDRLFDEEGDLFEALVGEFVDYADEQGFTPVFAMVQQLRYATYEAEHGPIYGDLLERLDEQHPDLITVDVADELSTTDDTESLYVRHGEGGHYSPETNERIATILRESMFEEGATDG